MFNVVSVWLVLGAQNVFAKWNLK